MQKKIQLSRITRVYIVVFFLFNVLFSSSASACGNPSSLSFNQEDSPPEKHSLVNQGVPQILGNENREEMAIQEHIQKFISDAGGDVKTAFRMASFQGDKEVLFFLLDNDQIDETDVIGAAINVIEHKRKGILNRLLNDPRIDVEKSFLYACSKKNIEAVIYLADKVDQKILNQCFAHAPDKEIVSFLLQDARIEVKNFNSALSKAIGHCRYDAALCIINDHRTNAQMLKEALFRPYIMAI